MATANDIEQLKQDIFSENLDISWNAMEQLSLVEGSAAFEFFVSLLNVQNNVIRNIGANGLREMSVNNTLGDNDPATPLFKAIFKEGSDRNMGSLVFALAFMDCRSRLKDLFIILLGNFSYESKIHVSTILGNHFFEFTQQDLFDIQQMWEDLKAHPEKCPDFEGNKEMIQDNVKSYLAYLQ